MANSSIISELKDKIIMDIVQDDEIVDIIDSPDKDKKNWSPIYMIDNPKTILKGFTPVIYKYHKNTNLISENITFITVMVNLPDNYSPRSNTFQNVRLIIYIVSNDGHMRIDNNTNIQANRNDYLSILLDRKFNGIDAGCGRLNLISNVEGIYDENFNYRKLIFETVDVNNSMC